MSCQLLDSSRRWLVVSGYLHSMDELLNDTNRTWMRYQLVLAGHGCVISGLLRCMEGFHVGTIRFSIGFKWALVQRGRVIS